jgi:WD40 repeat protein
VRPIYSTVKRVRGVLSAGECAALVEAAERSGFEKMGGDYPGGYRNNDRAIRDDAELAASLFSRIAELLPETLSENGRSWRLVGLNDRFRLCRYRNGQSFTRHRDGAHVRADGARSFLTCQVYLNDDFTGGHTRFFACDAAALTHDVRPERGAMIVFDHRSWHDGEAVTAGTKYVLRTDAIYAPCNREALPLEHDGYVWSLSVLDENTIASGSRDRTIRIWRRGERWGADRILTGHSASVTALAHAQDGALWSGSRDRTLRRWVGDSSATADTGACILALATIDGDAITATSAGTIERWRSTMQRTASASAGSGWIHALARYGSNAIASAGDDATLRLWRAVDLAPIAAVELDAPLRSLAVCNDCIYAGSAIGTITQVAANDDRLHVLRRWRAHSRAIDALAIVGTERLASGGEDCAVHVWNAALTRAATREHGDFVRALAWHPRIGLIAAGYDRRLSITPLRDGEDASGDE